MTEPLAVKAARAAELLDVTPRTIAEKYTDHASEDIEALRAALTKMGA